MLHLLPCLKKNKNFFFFFFFFFWMVYWKQSWKKVSVPRVRLWTSVEMIWFLWQHETYKKYCQFDLHRTNRFFFFFCDRCGWLTDLNFLMFFVNFFLSVLFTRNVVCIRRPRKSLAGARCSFADVKKKKKKKKKKHHRACFWRGTFTNTLRTPSWRLASSGSS
jgi:hypothetical protein